MPGTSMMSLLPRLTTGRALSTWDAHAWAIVVAALLLIGYVAGLRRVARLGATWRASSATAWLVGVALFVIATLSSVAVYSDALFWMHMVQHLLLIMVTPIFLVLGRPLDLAVAAFPGPRLRNILRGRTVSVITNPGLGIALYAAAIAGTHLTGFMDSMMAHPWLHDAEAAVYVVVGFLFFLPLLGAPPIRWQIALPLRMAWLVVAMPVDTFTGVILGQTERYPWPMMAAVHPMWAPSLLSDLHAGGAIMWVGGDAIMAVLFGVCAVAWARRAGAGDGSELGTWLSAARVNYQAGLTGAADSGTTQPAQPPTGDSDEDLAAYNAYLARLHQRS